MPQTLYEAVWIFMIYAFIGWCTEVSYAALDLGKFVNRGFLNGPYCPIYGFGVLIVVAVLTPLKENLLILFLGSFVLTSVLEYITGYVLEKAFHNKWWDYSDLPFNVKGYICLKFSVLWGLACSFIMLILHPLIFGFVHLIPKITGTVCLVLLTLAFTVDCIFTISNILNFNKRLTVMGEIADKLKKISDEIGENIYEKTADAMEKKEMYENLSRRYKELAEKKIHGHNRLLKAFPGMKSKIHEESLRELKEHVKLRIKKRTKREE